MYTHIQIDSSDAKKLFEAFARKPGECGAVTEPTTFDQYFALCWLTFLPMLNADLKVVLPSTLYELKFRTYLARVPRHLEAMESRFIGVEIVRPNSAPTKAHAGYYEDPKTGCTALIERVFPTKHDQCKRPIPLYAQNITVFGPTLGLAQQFNSNVSQGFSKRFLVNPFE